MNRQSLVVAVAVTALLAVAACGSDDETEAGPTAATSTAAAASPSAAGQPQGADGVTYEIQNWDEHADDPAVLAWKVTNEAIGASINGGKLSSAVGTGMNKKVLRQYLPSVQGSWKQDLVVRPVAKVKIQQARTTSTSSALVVCLWGPSTGLYKKSGEYVGDPENFWVKQTVRLKAVSGRWVISAVDFDGKCTGEAPA